MTNREIDALVAEKVMGFRRPSEKSISAMLPFNTWPRHYSTSIADAWTVVEKIRDDNFNLEEHGTHWKAHFGSEWAGDESAPRAICIAALRSVGVEV